MGNVITSGKMKKTQTQYIIFSLKKEETFSAYIVTLETFFLNNQKGTDEVKSLKIKI